MYDIVFISYNEGYAEQNWGNLKARFPTAKRINGIKGIHQAHITAAKKCFTKMFWVVDADAQLVEDFNFDYEVDNYNLETVHVWRSINPINDLTYGYGGVKLLPRKLTINMDVNNSDMTTSISDKFKAVEQISNITAFNTDPYSTWRSAFRECVKLASKTIRGQVDNETEARLEVWCSVGKDRRYGEYAINGANDGRVYGLDNNSNPDALRLINNYDWLYERFSASAL
jgi:hypothetical protein